jgi:PAS domain S-box-containing protein
VDQPFCVLVVDDERGVREGCKRVLSPYAQFVDTAESGEEAIAKFETGRYDLALVDIKMPGISGLDLLDVLHQRDPYLVAIVITGFATLETAIAATKRGAYDFLPKPFSPDELMAKVWNGLERRRLALEARRLREERERRLLEVATEQSRLRTIINCMQDGVLVTNREGQLVLYNPAAVRLLSLGSDPLPERQVSACIANAELIELFEQASSGDSSCSMLTRELAVENDSRTLMANVAPVRDEAGDVLGAVALLRDITELKALDRAKSQFVSMVSHELRAPLAAIEGYLGLILGGATRDNPQEERSMLSRSRERALALVSLIDDLLDISRIEAGTVARNVEPTSLAPVVDEVCALLGPQAKNKGVKVFDEVPDDLPQFAADREDIARIITNLLSNAIKYNRPGGKVWLRAAMEGEYLRFEVEDTGLGIPPDALPAVFDEFFRVKRPETREITGTGLGLTITKRLVESYQGTITVSSDVGRGTTFVVRLPRLLAVSLSN